MVYNIVDTRANPYVFTMLTLVLVVFVFCVVCLWLRYGRLKSSSHPLPPPVPGMLPVIGLMYRVLKSFTSKYFGFLP